MSEAGEGARKPVTLRRSLGLSLLVFYGVGVTVGAGIFALIGEIVRTAGDHAPLAFLLAGLIAGTTGWSYAKLSSEYPRAAGEALYVNIGLGKWPACVAGYGVTVTAIISSAVISIAFAGYLGALIPVAQPLLVVLVLLSLSFVAWLGVRESVALAAVITLLEVGTLIVVVVAGAPFLVESKAVPVALSLPTDSITWSLVFSACIVSFFAFIGFEDIANMAEEAIDPKRVMPRAIVLTLLITIVIYVAVALIAVAIPDRIAFTSSDAPVATMFALTTGYSAKPVSVMASLAMVNGILVQIVMASRVIYGMTREGLAPRVLGKLHARRQTPGRAIVLVTVLIGALALGFPLISLAKATSFVTLTVFILVNLALWRIGAQPDAVPVLRRWRYWGLFGATLSTGLLATEIVRLVRAL